MGNMLTGCQVKERRHSSLHFHIFPFPPHVEGGVHAVSVRDAQIAVLRHRLSETDKSMVRLKEVFRERIAAFREACYCLFGYR